MAEEARLSVGLVGCGYQGGILARNIGRSTALRLVACADPDPAAANQVAAGRAATYASIGELLSDVAVDVISVATPHHVLYECSLAAIEAGKHVLAEKPIGIDEKEAAQLEEAVARAGVCFMSGYSFRYIPGVQKAHELLQAGAVGTVYAIVGTFGVGPMSSGWSARPETGGGPLLYVGSHLVDWFLWYLQDEPVEVSAYARYRADTHAEEVATFSISFAGGALAHGIASQASRFGSTLDIYGRQGWISLRAGYNFNLEVESSTLPAYGQPTTLRFPRLEDVRDVMTAAQLADFVAAVQAGRQPSVSVREGRRVLRVLDAISTSARRGAPVRLC